MRIFFAGSFILFVFLISSCQHKSIKGKEKAKQEILQVEKDFEKMAAEKGIAEAFGYFADSSAVIKSTNDSLIHGKEGIRNFFTADRFKTASVKWSPDFVDASSLGDLGYSYGK